MKRRSMLFVLLLAAAALAACGSAATAEPDPPRLEGSKPDAAATAGPTAPVSKCTETDPHPIGQSIAASYEVDYEQVMIWFCAGTSFDDILLALETHDLTDASVDELITRADEVGWDQVWVEYGVTGEIEAEAGSN